MSNKIVFIPIRQHYPFNTHILQSTSQIQTQKIISFNQQSKNAIKEKIRKLKSLGFTHLVRLLSTTQDQESVTMNFEYIPTKFQLNLQDYSDQLLQKIQNQLLELSQRLTTQCIDHKFDLNNIGFDSNNNLKYYLGLNFQNEKTMNKEESVLNYRWQLETIFEMETPMKKKSIRETWYHQTMDTCKEIPFRIEQQIFIETMKDSNFHSATNKPRFLKGSNPSIIPKRTNCTNEEKKQQKKKSVETKPSKYSQTFAKINRIKYSIKELTHKKGLKVVAPLTFKENNHNFNQIINNQNTTNNTVEFSTKNILNLTNHYQNQQQSNFEKLFQNYHTSKPSLQDIKKEHVQSSTSLQYLHNQENNIMISSRDSRCHEFMQLLQDDRSTNQQQRDLNQINLIIKQGQTSTIENKNKNQQIKTRMHKAISSSMKLLNSLRPKEPVNFQ